MTRFNIQWTAKTLTNQMNKGKVNFDNAVQRGLVWDNGKKEPSHSQYALWLCHSRYVLYTG